MEEEENEETQARDTRALTDAQRKREQEAVAEITSKFGYTCTSGACRYVEMDNAEIIKHVRSVQPAGARADAADLISIGSYSSRMKDVRTERTFVDIALEFDFDSNVVRALKQLRIDAHKGVKSKDIPTTDVDVPMKALTGGDIDELRKARKDASTKSRSEKKGSTRKHRHGGAGEHIANFFTWGGYSRSKR